MSTKQKRPQRPRLERRNALKNVNYDASISSTSSSSFDDQSTHRTRSLEIPPISNRTSFRIEGIEGEFDRICRSLGLSGPEDFAIPAADWEARKNSSPSGNFPSSRFRDHYNSPRESTVNSLSVRFKGKVRVNDELKHEHESSKLMDGIRADSEAWVRVSDEGGDVDSSEAEVRVKVSDEVKHEDDDISELVSVRSSRAGEGIKGTRPPLLATPQPPLLAPRPLLAPPPLKTSSVVDNMSSTWDLFRSFGPCDDEDLGSPKNTAINVDEVEENEDVIEPIVVKQDITEARLSDSTAFSETCSDISDYDNDDDIYTTIREPMSSISPTISPTILPNRIFGPGFKAWQKGDFLGSGSFGTVYEGFTE